jgi:hypothetical protein
LAHAGDNGSDLELSDEGSESSDEESDESSEYDSDNELPTSANTGSSPLATPTFDALAPPGQLQDAEFVIEVAQSLERAFAEGHSVDNAAVELKTLRMVSNVPLTRVREAVISAIVEDIKIVDGALPQRKEISRVIGRWGELIDRIGGVDAVETVSLLQVRCVTRVIFRDCNTVFAITDALRVIRTLSSFRTNTGRIVSGGYRGGGRYPGLAQVSGGKGCGARRRSDGGECPEMLGGWGEDDPAVRRAGERERE